MPENQLFKKDLPVIVKAIADRITAAFKIPAKPGEAPSPLVQAVEEQIAKSLGFNSLSEVAQELKQLRAAQAANVASVVNINSRIDNLPTNDDLIIALAKNTKQYIKGINLIHDEIVKILSSQGVSDDDITKHDEEVWAITKMFKSKKFNINTLEEHVIDMQSQGNLPKATAQEKDDSIDPSRVLSDKGEILVFIKNLLDPEKFKTKSAEINKFATNFLRRTNDDNRKLERLVSDVKASFKDDLIS